jgi:hypothetical protein
MYHTTGFTRDEIVELCALVHAVNEAATKSEKVTCPPILGLFTSVVVTLTYLRRTGSKPRSASPMGCHSPRSAVPSRP